MQKREFTYGELDLSRIAPGDLYWINSSGNEILFCVAGDLVEQSMVDKFKRMKRKIFIVEKCNLELISTCVELLEEFKKANPGRERMEKWHHVVHFIKQNYWDNAQYAGLLDFVIVTERVFNRIENDKLVSLYELDIDLFKRLNFVSSTLVMVALSLGYYDFHFLSDLYNSCFLTYFHFDREQLTPSFKVSLEKLRNGESVSEEFKEILVMAIQKAQWNKDILKSYLYQETNFRVMNYFYEDLDGNGPFVKANRNEMTDLEMLIVFVNHLYSYERNILEEFSEKTNVFQIVRDGVRQGMQLSLRVQTLMYQVFNRQDEILVQKLGA